MSAKITIRKNVAQALTQRHLSGATAATWNLTWKNEPFTAAAYSVLVGLFGRGSASQLSPKGSASQLSPKGSGASLSPKGSVSQAAGAYAPMGHKEYTTVTKAVKELGMGADVGLSVRAAILKDRVMSRYGPVTGKRFMYAKRYAAGEDILALSAAADFPPSLLLRVILTTPGGGFKYSVKTIRDVFARRVDAADYLNERDLAQYRRAERNDAESVFNQGLVAVVAARNENLAVGWFMAAGIGLRTQDELVAEQVAKHGRAVITPDILFTDNVYINGAPVRWIDFKDYAGTARGLLYESNKKQAARYYAAFGPGAIIYRRSFVEGLHFPGTVCLDGRALPISWENL